MIKQSCLVFFASLLMPGMGGSSIESYTWSSPSWWVDLRVNPWRRDNRYHGRGWPFRSFISPCGRNCICWCSRLFLISEFPFILFAISRVRQQLQRQQPQSVQPLGTIGSFFSTVLQPWTCFGNISVGKPLKKEISKTLRSWLGLPMDFYFLFSFLPTMIITNNGENMDLMKQYLPMDGWWKLPYSRCPSMCAGIAILLKQIVTEVRDFYSSLLDFTWAKSLVWTCSEW